MRERLGWALGMMLCHMWASFLLDFELVKEARFGWAWPNSANCGFSESSVWPVRYG